MIILFFHLVFLTNTFYSTLTVSGITYNKLYKKTLTMSKFKYNLYKEIYDRNYIDEFIQCYSSDFKNFSTIDIPIKFHKLIFINGIFCDGFHKSEIYNHFCKIDIGKFRKKKQLQQYEKIMWLSFISFVENKKSNTIDAIEMLKSRFIMAYVNALEIFINDDFFEKIRIIAETKAYFEIDIINHREYYDKTVCNYINQNYFDTDTQKKSGKSVLVNLNFDNVVNEFVDVIIDIYKRDSAVILVSFPFPEIFFYCIDSILRTQKYNIKSHNSNFIEAYEINKDLIRSKFLEVTKILDVETCVCVCEKKCEIIFCDVEKILFLRMLSLHFNCDYEEIDKNKKVLLNDVSEFSEKMANFMKDRMHDKICEKNCSNLIEGRENVFNTQNKDDKLRTDIFYDLKNKRNNTVSVLEIDVIKKKIINAITSF